MRLSGNSVGDPGSTIYCRPRKGPLRPGISRCAGRFSRQAMTSAFPSPFIRRLTARRSGQHVAVWILLGSLMAQAGCVAPPPLVQGQDASAAPWQQVAAGLFYSSFSPWSESRVHVLSLDLRQAGLRLELSAPQARGLAMDQRPQATLAVASFNASFFDRGFVPRGITVSQGDVWAPVLAAEASPSMACDRLQRCRITFTNTATPPSDAVNVVAGTPWLVRAGQPRTDLDDASCPALCARTHPRTAIGLAGQGRWLLVVLAEGRRPPLAGISLVQLSLLMRDLGAEDAINLDGGGSSTLWLQGRAVMARPANEPAERALANAIHIVRHDNGAAGAETARP